MCLHTCLRIRSKPHARRTGVYTYGDLAGSRVLLVDDEITTGGTLRNLTTVLHHACVHVVGVACLIEDTTADARPLLASLGVPLCTLTEL